MKKIIMAVVIAGMTGGAYAAEFRDLTVTATDLKALVVADVIAVAAVSKGYIEAITPIVWVPISGGKFTMGTNSTDEYFEDARPPREVAIKTFEMSKTAVTVAQYNECVLKGSCTAPGTGDYCNWSRMGRALHPVNCVSWDQANQYAKFKGARLPSESEWEYAATSGGNNWKYPWGNDKPKCDRAVMFGGSAESSVGCGARGTMPVCSKPAGNSLQGLCDMAGNVRQWVQDTYHNSYAYLPADGSAFEGVGDYEVTRVLRGGAFLDFGDYALRADSRDRQYPRHAGFTTGFRLAR